MDFNDLERVDKQCMFKTYDKWPEIATDSMETKFEKLDFKNIDHIIFAGMGGSGSIGDTISTILSKKDIHVSNVRGYLLPKTVDENTLVIATSVSGNTEEVLNILKNVNKTNAKAVGFSSGGLLEKYCVSNNIFYQKIPMIHSPRASLTSFLYSILSILDPILPIDESEIYESISFMKKIRDGIYSKNLSNENSALDLAKFTRDIVSIYYPRGFHSAAIRYKNCLQENTKLHAIAEDVIESCHNGIVAWEKESVVKPVLIQGKDDHEKTILRWKILKEFFEMNDIKYKVINSVDGNILSKITNLIYLLDYSTIYSAVLNNTDPSPVISVDFIKKKLKIQE